jgi:hypothetical protein
MIVPHLEKLESMQGYPVLAYYMADNAGMADEQMVHLYGHLRRLGHQPHLGLWVYSRGGATEVPWKMISLLRQFADRLSVLIPYRANSAATLLALGADEIVMTELAELGPIDPTRRHPLLPAEEVDGKKNPIPISVQDLRHLLTFLKREMGEPTPEAAATVYSALFGLVHPLAIGALEQSWGLSRQVAANALATHMDAVADKPRIDAIVEALSDSYKSHLYQISRTEARALGLPVTDAEEQLADAMLALWWAYQNMTVEVDGEIAGKPAKGSRVGHIDSGKGTSIGVAMAVVADSSQGVVNWQSVWSDPAGQAESPDRSLAEAAGGPEPPQA